MGSVIVGTGLHVPEAVVTNADLARIMDTSDEWIAGRTGVRERRFAEPGVGPSSLAVRAGAAALDDAGVRPAQVDMLVTATMTPDTFAPGIAALVQDGLGLGQVAAYDIRQQCSGFLYGLDLADAMIGAGRVTTALVVGAEVHAGFLPWSAASWETVLGRATEGVGAADFAENTRHRDWSVLFGDGAGAMVLRREGDRQGGFLGTSLHTDGRSSDLIRVPGVGFASRPYVDAGQLAGGAHLPVMDGAGLYRQAVRLMPEAIRTVVGRHGMEVGDLDLVIAHQANDRILAGVRRRLGLDESRVPSNIARYGNTTAATLPILFHELRKSERVAPGALVCFAAFGAGSHYGAALYREPAGV